MIIEFIETAQRRHYTEDGTPYTRPYDTIFLIDTAKIPAFLETVPYALEKLFFVKPSLTAAADGVTELSIDYAQAFCDEPDWYVPIFADDGKEPEITVHIQVSNTFCSP